MRADQLLPEHVNQIDHRGTAIRKGTVGAFLVNASVWLDQGTSESARANAGSDIADALPALHALGLFDVLEIRDAALRAWVDTQISDVSVSEVHV